MGTTLHPGAAAGHTPAAARWPPVRPDKQTLSLAAIALLMLDVAVIWACAALAAGWVDATLPGHAQWLGADRRVDQTTLLAATLAPFFLYDRRFRAGPLRQRAWDELRSHALRFAAFVPVLLLLGLVAGATDALSDRWLLLWLLTSGLLTLLVHGLGLLGLARLRQRGRWREVVAVVGAGRAAESLMLSLRQAPAGTVEVLGAFAGDAGLARLVELGKHRHIDWILVATPAAHAPPPAALVQRLMSLAAPIAWTAPTHDAALPAVRGRWQVLAQAADDALPRWCLTLLALPLRGSQALLRLGRRSGQADLSKTLSLRFDDHDLDSFAREAATFGQDRFGYVVTPNTDHVIRLGEDPAFRALYDDASYVLLDSRFLSHLLRLTRGLQLPVCTGSDLTLRLFEAVIAGDDRVVLVGGSARQAELLRLRFGLTRLVHHNPPMGFIHDEVAVERCLQFVERHSPFRFCLLAVGSPQQERLAQRLQARGSARGLALCVGASIDFLTGDEQRSPAWLQRLGLEWTYRLARNPGRLAGRYLRRGPRIFSLLRRSSVLLRPSVRSRTDIARPGP